MSAERLDPAWISRGRARGAAPTLVLAHSLGTDARMWSPQLDAFEADHHLVLFDLPGHGRAPMPTRPCTLATLTEQVCATLASAGVVRFRFCGISLGGLLGLSLALSVPDRIEALIVSNTAARIGSPEGWRARIGAVQASGMASIVDGVFARWFDDGFAAREPALHAAMRQTFLNMDPQGYAACCEALASADLRADVGRIGVPTLVIGGGRDEPTPAREAEWLHDRIGGSELTVIEGASHLANLDRPEAFTERVRRFLAARPA